MSRTNLPLKRRASFGRLMGVTVLVAGTMTLGFTPILGAQSREGDLGILSAAAALELQAVAAYQAGAATGNLSPPILQAAIGFMEEHQAHAKALNDTLEALGGERVEAHQHHNFSALPDEQAILELALELEEGAASAYTALAANLENKHVLLAAAGILRRHSGGRGATPDDTAVRAGPPCAVTQRGTKQAERVSACLASSPILRNLLCPPN